MMSIDLNGIKSSAWTTYQIVSSKVSEWSGHCIRVLKLGTESALPFLQDKRVAVISLIAANIILIVVGHLFNRWLLERFLPDKTETQSEIKELVLILTGFGILVSGVRAFSNYAKLPLGWPAIVGISATVVFAYSFFDRSDKQSSSAESESENSKAAQKAEPGKDAVLDTPVETK